MNLHLFTNTLQHKNGAYVGDTSHQEPLKMPIEAMTFDGATFDKDRDGKRLTAQIYRVYAAIKDGQWHTLSELAKICGDPEASVSARLRDMRKPRYNSMQIERRYVRRGLHEYRLTLDKIVE